MKPAIEPHKLPSLDWCRAVSIALVLLAHSTYAPGFPAAFTPAIDHWFDLGSIGVRFFFIISGFLITYLLLQEQARTGGISLKNFYIRRALRILPVYFLYLLVLGVGTAYVQSPAAWAANLTFTTNFFWSPFPTSHLWSLGVEEQFYLLWPWFAVLACRRGASALRGLLIIPIVLAPLLRVMACKHWYPDSLAVLFNTGSFFVRCDSLAYGCLGAVLFTQWRSGLEWFFARYVGRVAILGVLLIVTPVGLRLLHVPARVEALTFDSMQAIGFGLLLLQSLFHAGQGFYRALNWPWIRQLGILSYSIYIWQQMFCGGDPAVFGRATNAWWTHFPIWILTALVAACISYFVVEKPLFRLRARFRAEETFDRVGQIPGIPSR